MADKMKIEGSVAVVTGGAQGIGEAICVALLQRGGKVSILDVNVTKGKAIADKLKKEYGNEHVMFVPCDVTSKSQMEDAFHRTKDLFGSIDIVCNNAGISGESDLSKNWPLLKKLVDINVTGVLLGTHLAIQHMGTSSGKGRGGVIINVASMAGLVLAPDMPGYAATKHAVVGLTINMEGYKKTEGIRVNCVCPSFTDTALLQNNRVLSAQYDSTVQVIRNLGIMRPELVALGVIELIEDKSKYGAVQMITKRKGIQYARRPSKL